MLCQWTKSYVIFSTKTDKKYYDLIFRLYATFLRPTIFILGAKQKFLFTESKVKNIECASSNRWGESALFQHHFISVLDHNGRT